MTKESIYELQKIDCNCNDCIFMERDFATYGYWENWNRVEQLDIFERKRSDAFKIANSCLDEVGKKTLLHFANKMRFIFDKSTCTGYGNCLKFNKPVSFIPNTCQLETQKCFTHRRSLSRPE